jgi:two-component system response regulator PilR (NtrC family)
MDKKLLIIDDDFNYLTIVEKQMSKESFNVTVADTLPKIYDYLNQNSPDIILLDVIMNNGEGLIFLKKLSSIIGRTPLIVISRGKDIDLIEKSFSYGAFDYLIKPLNLRDLKNKINFALEQRVNKNTYHV